MGLRLESDSKVSPLWTTLSLNDQKSEFCREVSSIKIQITADKDVEGFCSRLLVGGKTKSSGTKSAKEKISAESDKPTNEPLEEAKQEDKEEHKEDNAEQAEIALEKPSPKLHHFAL